MATSPSDPYKSRIVRGVVRQVRRLLDRGQTTIRRAQVAASWSAQILLYPVYALFQTGRLIGKTVERSQDEARLKLEADPERYDIPLTVQAAPITAETPIHNILQSLQALELPANCAVQGQEAEAIRAIGSDLDSHDLVLVTNYNQILHLPDPHQQAWLKQRLIYEIAVYNQRSRSSSLPFQRVARMLKGISTAIRQQFSGSPPIFPPPSSLALATQSSTDLAVDDSIKQSLLAVRDWMVTTQVSLVRATTNEKMLAQKNSGLSTIAKIQVQGVASLLQHRRLILVSDTNDVLDILTPAQQHFLYQRIAWETAHYQRYLRLQESVSSLPPLRPPAKDSLILPPIRAFQWLMTWMQSGAVAMATNLFRESSWLACPLPPSEPKTSQSSLLIVPSLQTGASPTPAGQLVFSQNATELRSVPQGTGTLKYADADRFLSSPTSERSQEYIDTDVTWVDYEQSWLERVMHWLDRLFLWLENSISQLWKSLTK